MFRRAARWKSRTRSVPLRLIPLDQFVDADVGAAGVIRRREIGVFLFRLDNQLNGTAFAIGISTEPSQCPEQTLTVLFNLFVCSDAWKSDPSRRRNRTW